MKSSTTLGIRIWVSGRQKLEALQRQGAQTLVRQSSLYHSPMTSANGCREWNWWALNVHFHIVSLKALKTPIFALLLAPFLWIMDRRSYLWPTKGPSQMDKILCRDSQQHFLNWLHKTFLIDLGITIFPVPSATFPALEVNLCLPHSTTEQNYHWTRPTS